MTSLSLHVLDIATNSAAAHATKIEIFVSVDTLKDTLSICIKDNGRGIERESLKNVTEPFFTTRTTSSGGMGLPLLKTLCEDCGGRLEVKSPCPNGEQGTLVDAVMTLSSVNRPPLGDLGSVFTTLILSEGDIRYILTYSLFSAHAEYRIDTDEIRAAVGDGLDQNCILTYIGEMINENIENINGGLTI